MVNELKTCFEAERGWIHNLGDALVPYLLSAMGFRCVVRSTPDCAVLNPGRCLLVIGSLLTSSDLRRIAGPIDVWGCGWKGIEAIEGYEGDLTFHAVRGPLTAAGLCPGKAVALGDPALLLPHFFPRRRQAHGKTLLIQHLDRVESTEARRKALSAGCDVVRTPYVLAAMDRDLLRRVPLGMFLQDARRWLRLRKTGVHRVWDTVDAIAGASFVLTGSLHGAILAQAYGVPWSAFTDGCADSPAKWRDWGSYLGVSVTFARSIREGRDWWESQGSRARIRGLAPLLKSFPYLAHSRTAEQLIGRIEAVDAGAPSWQPISRTGHDA